MQARFTTTLRSRLADALIGLAVPARAAPSAVWFGNGASSGQAPQDTLYRASFQGVLTVSRDGANQVLLTAALPPDIQATTINELGIFAADGVMLLHVVFASFDVVSGAEITFPITLNPEVIA